MYFKTQRIKALVSTCEHCDVRIIERNVDVTTMKNEMALQDEYFTMNKEGEKE
jgi:hypothetical protein